MNRLSNRVSQGKQKKLKDDLLSFLLRWKCLERKINFGKMNYDR